MVETDVIQYSINDKIVQLFKKLFEKQDSVNEKIRDNSIYYQKIDVYKRQVLSPKKEKSLEETAQNALEQIKEKKYKEQLIEAGINENNIKAYGFAFEGKNVLILD